MDKVNTKAYMADRRSNGCMIWVERSDAGGAGYWLPKHDPANHSPDGFEWGYGGSGPAALASSILYDATGCKCCYQEFKSQVVQGFPHDAWRIRQEEVKAFIEIIRKRRGHGQDCELLRQE